MLGGCRLICFLSTSHFVVNLRVQPSGNFCSLHTHIAHHPRQHFLPPIPPKSTETSTPLSSGQPHAHNPHLLQQKKSKNCFCAYPTHPLGAPPRLRSPPSSEAADSEHWAHPRLWDQFPIAAGTQHHILGGFTDGIFSRCGAQKSNIWKL